MSGVRQKAAIVADKQDRRARKSRRALWDALLSLLQDHHWAAISIQMICDRADLARSTFYAHFQTKQDLLDTGFVLGQAEIAQAIAHRTRCSNRLATVDWLVDHLVTASGFHRRLHGSAAGHIIMARFQLQIQHLLGHELSMRGQPQTEMTLTFATGGVFAVLAAWMARGCVAPVEQISEELHSQLAALLRA